jgi:hypothetical protein
MESGYGEGENGVGTWGDFGGDLVKMKLQGLGVAGGRHQRGAGSAFRAYRAEQIRRLSKRAESRGALPPLAGSCRG